MTLMNTTRALALSAVATFGAAGMAAAATCSISMPASGNNANVAAINANLVAVLQSQYPNVSFDAPTATSGSNVEVPDCNAEDFSPTGANISNVGGGVPQGGGEIGAGAGAAAAAGALALVVVFSDSSDTTGSTPDT